MAELLDVQFDNLIANELSDWDTASLLDIASYKNSLAMQRFRPVGDDPDLPVLKIRELGQGYCGSGAERCRSDIDESVAIYAGDLVFSWPGTLLLGFWAGGDAGLNQHLFKVTSDAYPSWFYYMWTKQHMRRFIALAKTVQLLWAIFKRSALQESEVLIPSADVMVELNAEMQPVVDEMIGLKVQSRKLGELRDALLSKLISGEIDVSEVELPMQPNHHLPGVLAPGADVAMAAVLRNMSDAPVYNVIITCVGISGAGPNAKGEDNGHDYPCRACVGILPPGTWYAWLPTNGPGMHVRTAPEAAFTDANGRPWVWRGNGKLEEIEAEPVSFYGRGLPVSWGECKRLD